MPDFPKPSEAFHDETDGMFKMREPEAASVDGEKMIQLESGIYAPKPKLKEHRILWIDTQNGHFQLEADETVEELQEILRSAALREKEWYTLTDPAFGYAIYVPAAALLAPIAIVSGLKDLEAIEDQQKAYDMQKRLARLASARQAADTLATKNLVVKNRN